MIKHTILFLAANPVGTDRLALDEEARAIREELERSGHRDKFELATRWAVRPMDLLRELRKLKPTIVHFSGHGGGGTRGGLRSGGHRSRDIVDEPGPTDDERLHGLFFQKPDGGAQLVSTAALKETFDAVGSSVKVVVLSACYSDAQAKVLSAHVDCVVGMRSSISDAAARNFAVGFYGALAECESVATAYKQGRAAISLEGLPDSAKPQLRVRDVIDADQLVLAAPTGEDLVELAAPDANALLRYQEYFRRQHCHIRVLGWPRPIDIGTLYTPAKAAEPDFLLRCDSGSFAGYDVESRRFAAAETPSFDASTLLELDRSVCVSGPPGSGKTMLLRNFGLHALHSLSAPSGGRRARFERASAVTNEQSDNEAAFAAASPQPPLPIYVELRRIDPKHTAGLEAALLAELAAGDLHDNWESLAALERLDLKFIALLDGLDEVDGRDVAGIVAQIMRLPRWIRCIVTCRLGMNTSALSNFSQFVLVEFMDEQIREFITRWFVADAAHRLVADDLQTEIFAPGHQSVKDLARTPLFLTLLCIVFGRSGKIPVNRIALYQRALDLLLEDWSAEKQVQRTRTTELISADKELDLLTHVALAMMRDGRLFVSAADLISATSAFLKVGPRQAQSVVDAIELEHGIIARRSDSTYSFSHLTLQEYLAARGIIVLCQVGAYVDSSLFDARWREVFLLVTAMGARGDVLSFGAPLVERLRSRCGEVDAIVRSLDSFVTGVDDLAGRLLALTLLLTLAAIRAQRRESIYDHRYATHTRRATQLEAERWKERGEDTSMAGPRELHPAAEQAYHAARRLDRALSDASATVAHSERLSYTSPESLCRLVLLSMSKFRERFGLLCSEKEVRRLLYGADSLRPAAIAAAMGNANVVTIEAGHADVAVRYVYAYALLSECAAIEVSRPLMVSQTPRTHGMPIAWYLAVPLDFGRPEAAQVNQLLATAYADRRAALTLAESVGVSTMYIDHEQAPFYLVRDIMKQAADEHLLERLLRTALSDARIAAYHAQLVALMRPASAS